MDLTGTTDDEGGDVGPTGQDDDDEVEIVPIGHVKEEGELSGNAESQDDDEIQVRK